MSTNLALLSKTHTDSIVTAIEILLCMYTYLKFVNVTNYLNT
jgi:hypothetical protein